VDAFLTLKKLDDAEWEESRAELQTGMLHGGVASASAAAGSGSPK
jgi:hypothetical protein